MTDSVDGFLNVAFVYMYELRSNLSSAFWHLNATTDNLNLTALVNTFSFLKFLPSSEWQLELFNLFDLDFQARLLIIFILWLLINLFCLRFAWKIYGERICDMFMKSPPASVSRQMSGENSESHVNDENLKRQ